MSDVFTKAKRSQVMSRIRGHGNKDTELALMELFRSHGITGWRRRRPVFGKPDFVFQKQRVAVFLDGCFWHSCPNHSNLPANNRAFWKRKLDRNKARDRLVNRTLRREGCRVIRVWEHDLTRRKRPALLLKLERRLDVPTVSRAPAPTLDRAKSGRTSVFRPKRGWPSTLRILTPGEHR